MTASGHPNRTGEHLSALRMRAERAEAEVERLRHERDTLAQAVAFVVNWHDLGRATEAKLRAAMLSLASDEGKP